MSLSGPAWLVVGALYGAAVLFALAGARIMAALPLPREGPRRWATPVLRGRTLQERLLDYVERRNAKRNDFDEVEAAMALGVSTRDVVDALHALQRKRLVRTK